MLDGRGGGGGLKKNFLKIFLKFWVFFLKKKTLYKNI